MHHDRDSRLYFEDQHKGPILPATAKQIPAAMAATAPIWRPGMTSASGRHEKKLALG
jgi:hypothetical protein